MCRAVLPEEKNNKERGTEKLTSKKIMKYFFVAFALAEISPSNGRFMCDIRWGIGRDWIAPVVAQKQFPFGNQSLSMPPAARRCCQCGLGFISGLSSSSNSSSIKGKLTAT